MERDSLILYAKAEDLYFQIYPTFRNYPKVEKQGLCSQMKKAFTDLLTSIAQAKEVVSKRKVYLQEASGYLQTIVTFMKLSRHQKYISKGFFEEIDLKITEIKKILIGFLKSTSSSRNRKSPQ